MCTYESIAFVVDGDSSGRVKRFYFPCNANS